MKQTTATDAGMRQVIVAQEPGRFKAWPANYGMWAWENEIVVMYEDGASDTSDINRHTYDTRQPLRVEQARSTDGGLTWRIEKDPILKPGPPGMPWNGLNGPAVRDLSEPIDFTRPNFALHFQMAHHEYGPHYFYYSVDRARSWQGPFRLPDWGFKTVNCRTDYLINGANDCMAFVSGKAQEGTEDGSETFMVRTQDGGTTWKFVARANRPTPRIGGNQVNFTIMPASVRLSPRKLLCLARCTQSAEQTHWIEAWVSSDNGGKWAFLRRIETGNSSTPPALTLLPNGWLVLTYGFRQPPFGIRARISKDSGATWTREIVLRSDGGNFDLGYTRNVLRSDGIMITAYYFNTDARGERRIEATLWNPRHEGRLELTF